LQRAVALKLPLQLGWYIYMLGSLRRHEEAIRVADQQSEMSVVGHIKFATPAVTRVLDGETESMVERIQNGLELDSTSWLLHMQLGWAYEVRKAGTGAGVASACTARADDRDASRGEQLATGEFYEITVDAVGNSPARVADISGGACSRARAFRKKAK
jgi:hypothetical protein